MSDIDTIVGAVGNRYVKEGLSSPSQLRSAATHWAGLEIDEILAVVEDHFERHRREYRSGSGDRCFPMVDAAVRRLLEARHGVTSGGAPDPDPPRRRGPRKVYNAAGGLPDVILDHDDVSAPGAPQPSMRGPRATWVNADSILEDDGLPAQDAEDA